MNETEKDLIELPSFFDEHWKGMPEFKAEDQTSQRKIILHFRNEDDVQKFAKLINQKITPKLPSLWFPEMPHRKTAHLKYIEDHD